MTRRHVVLAWRVVEGWNSRGDTSPLIPLPDRGGEGDAGCDKSVAVQKVLQVVDNQGSVSQNMQKSVKKRCRNGAILLSPKAKVQSPKSGVLRLVTLALYPFSRRHLIRPPATFSPSDAEKATEAERASAFGPIASCSHSFLLLAMAANRRQARDRCPSTIYRRREIDLVHLARRFLELFCTTDEH